MLLLVLGGAVAPAWAQPASRADMIRTEFRIFDRGTEVTAETRLRIRPTGTMEAGRILEGTTLSVQADVTPFGDWPQELQEIGLPRLGLLWQVPCGLSRVKWFGRGPGESYPDSHTAARLGVWSSSVDEMIFPYVMPQDYGNRHQTRWAELRPAEGAGESAGLRIEPLDGETFDLSAHPFEQRNLHEALHRADLRRADHLQLYTDYRVRGLGSASCGPGISDQHRIPVAPARFGLRLSIIRPDAAR